MGGRGSRLGGGAGGFINNNGSTATLKELPVAQFNVSSRLNGSLRTTRVEATLEYIENEATKLNHEQLKILDDNGFVIKAYDGKKHSVSYDGSYSVGKIVTHNHPQGYGGTFSSADVFGFLGLGQKEIRASAKEGIYSLKPNKSVKQDSKGFESALKQNYNKLLRQGEKKMNALQAKGETNRNVLRKVFCDELHNWYNDNASKYGYTYTFTPHNDYHI